MKRINRRDFLRYFGFTSVAIATGGLGSFITGCSSKDSTNMINFNNPLNVPTREGLFGILDVPKASFEISVKKELTEILKGKKTQLLVYQVNQGEKVFINPTFVLKKDEEFKAYLINEINEKTIIHWHGLKVDWPMDGHPINEIKKGEKYKYQFSVPNRGGTYWYHPHPYLKTPQQAYFGLAGLFIVEDEEELSLREELDLEIGKTDIPLVIQDKKFDEKGNLIYIQNEMDKLMGFTGDVILTNLTVNPYLEVGRRIYRFRILNGSNSRIYLLAFTKGKEKVPYYIIGTDGGLLKKPYHVTETYISPGERVDIIIDLSQVQHGEEVYLKSLSFDGMDNEDTGSMEMDNNNAMNDMSKMDSLSLGNGQEFYILKLIVNGNIIIKENMKIPQTLSDIKPINIDNVIIRDIKLSMVKNQWLINGETFQIDEYPIIVKKQNIELWDITNDKKSMPHPMHIHGTFFRVIARCNSPEQVRKLAVDNGGRLASDLGYKDTVLIWPGETVRVAIEFNHNFDDDQIYLFHCHNLEHEDMGMMINVKVETQNK